MVRITTPTNYGKCDNCGRSVGPDGREVTLAQAMVVLCGYCALELRDAVRDNL